MAEVTIFADKIGRNVSMAMKNYMKNNVACRRQCLFKNFLNF